MKTKYKINGSELIINFDFLYNTYEDQNKIKNIRKHVNKLLIDNNIKFNGNKIIIYKDKILIGTFYLTNYYLKKLNYHKNKNYLSEINSYFNVNDYVEINPEYKAQKILDLY